MPPSAVNRVRASASSLLAGLSLAFGATLAEPARAGNTAPVLLDDTPLHHELPGGPFAGIVLPLPPPADVGTDPEQDALGWFITGVDGKTAHPPGVSCSALRSGEGGWTLTCTLGADPPALLIVDLVIRERDTVERLESDDRLTLSLSLER